MKSIGDALMLRVPEPADAVRLGLHIVHDLMPGHGAPAVRVGLHHGSYVERDAVRERFGDELRVGVGVNSGTAVIGTIGGGGGRLDFTVIGDTVNTAVRVEVGDPRDGR